MRRRVLGRALLGLVLLSALGSSACVELDDTVVKALSDIGETRIQEPVIRDLQSGGLHNVGRDLAKSAQELAGACLVILLIYLWYRAQTGEPWIGLAKEWFIGAMCAVYIILSWDSRWGVPGMIYFGTQALAAEAKPPNFFLQDLSASVAASGKWLESITNASNSGLVPAAVKAAIDAMIFAASQGTVVAMMVFNAIGVLSVRALLYGMFTFAVVFHWVTAPLFATALVLPQTRRVFYGWLQSFLAVCLWPVIFAVLDRVMLIVPWATIAQSNEYTVGSITETAIAAFYRGQVSLMVVEFAFIATYLAVPIIASKIVSGSIRATTT